MWCVCVGGCAPAPHTHPHTHPPKLADRLHNMRTVYALAAPKQVAVAEETLGVWCSMAEYLGWHGLKVRVSA